jgi:hypothetical protein
MGGNRVPILFGLYLINNEKTTFRGWWPSGNGNHARPAGARVLGAAGYCHHKVT